MNLSIHFSETIEDISQKFTIKVRVLFGPRLDAGVSSAERGLTTEWERGDHLAISAGSHSPLRTKTFSFLAFTRLFFFLKVFFGIQYNSFDTLSTKCYTFEASLKIMRFLSIHSLDSNDTL